MDHDKLSRQQVTNIFNYVNLLNQRKVTKVNNHTTTDGDKVNNGKLSVLLSNKRLALLNEKLKLLLNADNNSTLHHFLKNYNKLELAFIDLLENFITVLENVLFLLKYLERSKHLTGKLNSMVLRISKIWMILTVKSSVWRYWKLLKLEKAVFLSKKELSLIAKLKYYTLINLGLCIVEIVELLEVPHLEWIVNIYSVYRMIGNGSLCLEDEEETILQSLMDEYKV